MRKGKHLLIWLSRIHRCRGFGIQSPSDYALVRYVINEHWPYYQYEKLAERGDDWLTGKIGRLLFRLANWRQPAVVMTRDYADYIRAGCRKAAIVWDAGHADIICMNTDADCREAYARMVPKAGQDTLLVIEGIWREPDFWREVLQDKRAVITFDLYYCGLVFFDQKRVKQNYIVNF